MSSVVGFLFCLIKQTDLISIAVIKATVNVPLDAWKEEIYALSNFRLQTCSIKLLPFAISAKAVDIEDLSNVAFSGRPFILDALQFCFSVGQGLVGTRRIGFKKKMNQAGIWLWLKENLPAVLSKSPRTIPRVCSQLVSVSLKDS